MDCAGHFGYIKLFLPIYHIGYFKRVVSMLQSVCKECSRILIDDLKQRKLRHVFKNRKVELPKLISKLKIIVDECKKAKYCPHCGFPVGKLKKMAGAPTKIVYFEPRDNDTYVPQKGFEGGRKLGGGYQLQLDLDEQKKISNELIDDVERSIQIELTPLRAYNILKNMIKEDINYFLMDANFQRPEDLLVTHIIVPPVCIRPTVKVGGDRTNEDDMTIKLYEIIKQNQF